MINENAPFPQANDFNKIMKLLNTGHEANLKDNGYIVRLLGGISSRQVSYYLAACEYIGIISKRNFTSFAIRLRELNEEQQLHELIIVLRSVPVFEYTINHFLSSNEKINTDELLCIMKKTVDFESDATYLRRISTITTWSKWLAKNYEQYKK